MVGLGGSIALRASGLSAVVVAVRCIGRIVSRTASLASLPLLAFLRRAESSIATVEHLDTTSMFYTSLQAYVDVSKQSREQLVEERRYKLCAVPIRSAVPCRGRRRELIMGREWVRSMSGAGSVEEMIKYPKWVVAEEYSKTGDHHVNLLLLLLSRNGRGLQA